MTAGGIRWNVLLAAEDVIGIRISDSYNQYHPPLVVPPNLADLHYQQRHHCEYSSPDISL